MPASSTTTRLQTILSITVLVTGLVAILVFLVESSIPNASTISETIPTSFPTSIPQIEGSETNNLPVDCGSTLTSSLARRCIFDEGLNGWVPRRCHNASAAALFLRNDSALALTQGAGRFAWYEDGDLLLPIPDGVERVGNGEGELEGGEVGGLERYLRVLYYDGRTDGETEEDETGATRMKAFTSERWHLAHCLYVWELGNLALEAVRAIRTAGDDGDGNGDGEVWVNERVLNRQHIEHCRYVAANQGHRINATAEVSFGFGRCVRLA
jgi:hypothetical protein